MRGGTVFAALLLMGGALAGCHGHRTSAEAPPKTPSAVAESGGGEHEPTGTSQKSPLKGTKWRLVEFQSMSDRIGTIRPDDPSVYTMRLNGDGTVVMRLNCNRARGTWSAEPSADDRSGRFAFGPLATTRAICPPPSMDERIAADAEYVRSYLLRGDRLYLSLMADAGIYAWEPITSD